MSKTKKIIANSISAITHPIFVPTLGAYLIYNTNTIFSQISQENINSILYLSFGLTFILPMIFIALFLGVKEIAKLKASDKNDRLFPLLIVLLSYSFTYNFFKDSTGLIIYNTFLLTVITGLTIALLINFFWKISLHMVGIGGIIALIVFLKHIFHAEIFVHFVAFTIMAGIIASVRLYLQEHSMPQILFGFALGFSSVHGLHLFV